MCQRAYKARLPLEKDIIVESENIFTLRDRISHNTFVGVGLPNPISVNLRVFTSCGRGFQLKDFHLLWEGFSTPILCRSSVISGLKTPPTREMLTLFS